MPGPLVTTTLRTKLEAVRDELSAVIDALPMEPPPPVEEPPVDDPPVVDDPPPEPEPEPDPEPDPDPPPGPELAPIEPVVIRTDKTVIAGAHNESRGDAYSRYQPHRAVSGVFLHVRRAARLGDITRPFPAPAVTVRWGEKTARIEAAQFGEGNRATLALDSAGVPNGWQVVEGSTSAAGVAVLPEFVHVENPGAPPAADAVIPSWTGSYDMQHPLPSHYAHAWVPAGFDPPPRPLAPRMFRPITTIPRREELYLSTIVPHVFGEDHQPSKTAAGAWTTSNIMGYYRNRQERRPSDYHLLDGYRGRAAVTSATWLRPHGAHGAMDGAMSSRVFHVGADGTVTTLCGDMHPEPRFWQDEDRGLVVVGDWSGVDGPKFFQGCWAAPFDPRTTGLVEREGGRLAHPGPIVQWANDAWHGRVLELTYDSSVFPSVPRVRVLVQGLVDPWACDYSEHLEALVVSERGRNRLLAVDTRTGEYEVLLASETEAGVRKGAEGENVPWTQTRGADVCYAPEGVRCQDNGVFYGSGAMMAIRRLDLDSRRVETLQTFRSFPDYIQLDVSDGSLGPRGTPVWAGWKVEGYPGMGGGAELYGNVHRGAVGGPAPPGRNWFMSLGYSSCVGGPLKGRMVFAPSSKGVFELRARTAEDAPVDHALSEQGWREWVDRGLHVAYGMRGFAHHRHPLPDDLSPAVLAYLDACSR